MFFPKLVDFGQNSIWMASRMTSYLLIIEIFCPQFQSHHPFWPQSSSSHLRNWSLFDFLLVNIKICSVWPIFHILMMILSVGIRKHVSRNTASAVNLLCERCLTLNSPIMCNKCRLLCNSCCFCAVKYDRACLWAALTHRVHSKQDKSLVWPRSHSTQ